MTALLFSILTFFSTFCGGLFALRNRDRLHLILGFTAGVLLGVISFEIFPEIINQINATGIDSVYVMVALVVGFLLFHILEKSIVIHHAHEHEYASHHHPDVGILSALALSGHSFMDGVGIGLGFQINPKVGFVVALAVIAHDFSDGINTVSLMLVNNNTKMKALALLGIDALAPVLGVLFTLVFTVSSTALVLYLGFFAGFLLYIGASDILPEAHSEHSSAFTIFMTIFGVLFMFIASRFI